MGHGPHEPHERPRKRHDHLVGVLAPRDHAAVALAQAHVGFPTDGLDGVGLLFEAPWHGATAFRGRPLRPGACTQHATGVGMARLGEGALRPPRTRGVC